MSSGGASAFKFRDPEGHPLELLQFAPDAVPDIWRARFAATPDRLFHGVDHTGLSVSDVEASQAFYVSLGFAAVHAQVNVGTEQARLDGFSDKANAAVSIVSLSPNGGARPGIELLGYRQPPPIAKTARDGSVSATYILIADPQGGPRPPCDPDGHRIDYAPAVQSPVNLS
jgi:catechol 2,3-dioxygenase-like lactoylglutathione lyase family enzyme